MDDLLFWLTMASVPGLDQVKFEKLCAAIPAAELCKAPIGRLIDAGLTMAQARQLISVAHSDRPLRCADWLAADATRHFVRFQDPAYPELLRQIKHPPLALFVQGQLAVLQQPQLAIVGTRQPSGTGKDIAFEFAAGLAQAGLTITSGLARGIDSCAHKGALSVGGKTVAVLGHGLQHLYPPQHQQLAEKIAEQGALVSEFLPDQAPQNYFFSIRNRIVVGLSLGTLVVEAAEKSGSLISANYAAEYSRELFAVPGSIRNPMAAGCHQLIQQGAKLCRNLVDIMEELAISETPVLQLDLMEKNNCQQGLFESSLLANVGDEATAIDLIASRAALPVADVTIALLQLELVGAVAAVPGGYIRVRRA